MSNSNHHLFKWQNTTLRESIFPARNEKLRDFLLFYWEFETLAEMREIGEEERENKLSEVANIIKSQHEELQDQFDNLTEAFDADKGPTAEELTGIRLLLEKKRLSHLDHDDLLDEILKRFDADPDQYPQWLQYMVVHFSGMRYMNAHGTWADPRYLLELIEQNQTITIPEVPETDTIPFPATKTALEKIKLLKPKIPLWMWKKIVRYTSLQVEEVAKNDNNWEVTNDDRNENGFDNNFWGNTLQKWHEDCSQQWRPHHQATLDPVVTGAKCNEISEHILHLRWLTPSGGLKNRAEWYHSQAKKTKDLPDNHPHKAIFKRATSMADFQPGASIFWLGWSEGRPTSDNVAYALSDFEFFPNNVKNKKSLKVKAKGEGKKRNKSGWKYRYDGDRLVRERKYNDQEIQNELNALERQMQHQRRLEKIRIEKLLEQKIGEKARKKEIIALEQQLKALKKDGNFQIKVEKQQKALRRSLAQKTIKHTLRWKHEAIVVSVEKMISGTYVLTYETYPKTGLNKQYIYHLIGKNNTDDVQVFVGYMPSLDNFPDNMTPGKFYKFLPQTFMYREHVSNLKLRLKEILRRDWILPGRYPEQTYPKPPLQKPITAPPKQADLIPDTPPIQQTQWVQIKPPKNKAFIVNEFFKGNNKKGYPKMEPVLPLENRQRLPKGTLVGVSSNHKENPSDAGDGTVQADSSKYYYLITDCEDYPKVEGTFILVNYTEPVADPVAFRKEQQKNPPPKLAMENELLFEATVRSNRKKDDKQKSTINCWKKKKVKTSSGLPAFQLPAMESRIQLQTEWNITVHSVLTGENGTFCKVAICNPLPEAVGLYVREQDISILEDAAEPETVSG